MHKIVPHLWFDKEAKEATAFYTSLFSNSKITNSTVLHDTPSGDCAVVSFELRGQPFMAISAGPYFKLNPSISFFVNFDPSKEEGADKNIDATWEKLIDGGKILMPLQEYPFSKRYGWVEDRYGVSWQLILTNPEGEVRPDIIPSFLFVKESYGKAEEAINFYLSIFKDSQMGKMMKYGPGHEPDKEDALMFADFRLLDSWFVAMDSAHDHKFAFNESVSFIVNCDTQEEIDYYWEKLSAVPESEQCGWLKDKFGISWQIVPSEMEEMMYAKDEEASAKVMQAVLKMKKFDIAELKRVSSQPS
jgi:predicted 3-demethylubiquinone-9 3-methyltransferase (glyoxalase superfamily)